MPSRPSSSPRLEHSSQASDESKDGLAKVELSDLDSNPPRQLAVEQDLMQLARLGELRSIQKLFDSGKFTPRSTDEQGITPLHWAAINGHHALCHFLIQSGADVNAKGGDANATPVLWASKRCNLQVISLLLANGADPLIRDVEGYNLLHSATLDGNVYQLVLLLHHPEITVDVPDAHGHTSLMWAAYKGFGACVDILLRWGADVHAVDETGFTPLHWALVKGNYVCIQKLVEYGSDRSVKSKPPEGQAEGDTPSMTASKMNSERQWHRALVDSGFDEAGNPLRFPVPYVNDRRWFFSRFFFFWPFVLGGLQLHMLAYLPVLISVPGVLVVGYALQYLVQRLFRWAPTNLKRMHHTPFLAGIFAGTLFWVGVRYVFCILPQTFWSHFFLNTAFIAAFSLCTCFYAMTMTADPGYIPKGVSRGHTKNTIDDLVDHSAFDEAHFCTQCMIRKPLRSKHCRRCGRCVAKEDHHCPWVDNCIGVNNHKPFILYVVFMILGIGLLMRLTIIYINTIPTTPNTHCTFLDDEYCSILSRDPLTIITNIWASLQLTWVVMLLFVHLMQVARAITTLETMKGQAQVEPIVAAIATGTMSADGAQINDPSSVASPAVGQNHSHTHKKKEGCLSQWSRLLGLDTFFTIAFPTRKGKLPARQKPPPNLFSRGVLRNCQDFWMDGPIFRRKKNGEALLGGEVVDYTSMYEVPKGGMRYRGAYEAVPTAEEGQA